MTDENDAMSNASGYAAGREDASGVRTVSPTDAPGFIVFAETYAATMADFLAERRHYMPAVSAAYDAWQATRGARIVPDTMSAWDSGPRAPARSDETSVYGYDSAGYGPALQEATDLADGWVGPVTGGHAPAPSDKQTAGTEIGREYVCEACGDECRRGYGY
jgi:hypothetical protein